MTAAAFDIDVDVAIVGGGVLGTSIAWHLTQRGVKRVALVERHAIGSGSSALAAGNMSHARSTRDLLSMVRATIADIDRMESMLGEPIGFRRTGSIRIAERSETGAQLALINELLNEDGVKASFIGATEAGERVPWLDAFAAHSILFIPDDGFVDGQNLALAYARAARAGGATILNHTLALAPRFEGSRLAALETNRGLVRFKQLVNAAGPWAGQMQGWFKQTLAAAPLRSHYWITAPAQPAWPIHPIVVLADAHTYIRPEVGGLLVGIQERQSRSFDDRTLPADVSQLALTDAQDWDLLAQQAPSIRRFLPEFDALKFKHHMAGITTYTADGRFLIGPDSAIENLFIAAGCCGTGVSCAGGISRLLCEQMLGLAPHLPPAPFNPGRFGTVDSHADEFIARCVASRANKSRR